MLLDPQSAKALCDAVKQAGERTQAIRSRGELQVDHKTDNSPVTEADLASQSVIIDALTSLFPEIPIISEEQEYKDEEAIHSKCWLIDPLDGTRDYILGRNDYSINVGLIENGMPAFGIIYAPGVKDLVYGGPGFGLFREVGGVPATIPPLSNSKSSVPRLLISVRDAQKMPVQEWIDKGLVAECLIHASAYKLALLACGEGDLFLRISRTYEWDTAAGDALLRTMGGEMRTADGSILSYKKRGLENGSFIAFSNHRSQAKALIEESGLGWNTNWDDAT